MKNRYSLVTIAILLVLTLLALGLRLYRLDAQSLWYDEGFSVYLAKMDLGEITARTAADIQPPLYYFLLHGWIQILGDGAGIYRALSLIFGVLSVPLLYGLAWELFRSRAAGLLAALLLAVSPLHVWYGQEVRMYTLFTFLCLLSSYLLLLVVGRAGPADKTSSPESESSARRVGLQVALWIAYTLATIAALYTHYFAFFVIAFQALYLLLAWIARGFPLRLLAGAVASYAVALLAYLPWLPHLATRYGTDVSYWPGRLKLIEVLVDITVFLVGGESVSESVGLILALGYALVLVLCLVVLVVWRARGLSDEKRGDRGGMPPLPLLFLLLYLLLPPALILALAFSAPKFNARYVMVSQPALLLLVAGGLGILVARRGKLLGNLLRWSVAGICLVFLLGVAAYANYQAYTDPMVARADFRGVARYIQRHMEPDETIILVSGHVFPVFDLYAPDVERLLLPDSPTLDTTKTLNYAIADDLDQWLAGQSGVWVVLWQDEVVDPVGYLTSMLDEVADEVPLTRGFSQIELRHYRLPPDARFSEEPSIAHPVGINFGNQLQLLGYTQTGEQQVTLFWEALQPLDDDYRVSLTLRDTTGQSWGQWDGRPTAYLYPTSRWQEGQVVLGRHDLILDPGLPPGDYGLEVGVYTETDPVGVDILDAALAPQGKRAMLGAVRLAVLAATPDDVHVPNRVDSELGGGLVLLGYELDRVEGQPGDESLLTLFWSVDSPPQDDYRVQLLLTDAGDQVYYAGAFPLTSIWHPSSTWQPGQAWRGQNTWRLPIQAEPGEAWLGVQLLDSSGAAFGPLVDLSTIEVLPTTRVFEAPKPHAPRNVNFDDRIILLGADLEPNPAYRELSLRVTLYWQALVEMDIPYTVFAHLLGPDGRVVSGSDAPPVDGARPTTGWVPGEYITDIHYIPIPGDLEPGSYVIEVGLYDAGLPAMPRLPIIGDDGQVEGDRVIFGPVEIQ